MSELEVEIEARVVQYAESKDCLCEKLVMQGKRGWPDRTLLTPNGKVAFIEMKRSGGRTSRQQLQIHGMLRRRGFLVFVYDTFEEAKKLIDRLCT